MVKIAIDDNELEISDERNRLRLREKSAGRHDEYGGSDL